MHSMQIFFTSQLLFLSLVLQNVRTVMAYSVENLYLTIQANKTLAVELFAEFVYSFFLITAHIYIYIFCFVEVS